MFKTFWGEKKKSSKVKQSYAKQSWYLLLHNFWMRYWALDCALRGHTFMAFTQKGCGGVLKFVTCLSIILFLNNMSMQMGKLGRQKNWSFFVDVINVWPLNQFWDFYNIFKVSKTITLWDNSIDFYKAFYNRHQVQFYFRKWNLF